MAMQLSVEPIKPPSYSRGGRGVDEIEKVFVEGIRFLSHFVVGGKQEQNKAKGKRDLGHAMETKFHPNIRL